MADPTNPTASNIPVTQTSDETLEKVEKLIQEKNDKDKQSKETHQSILNLYDEQIKKISSITQLTASRTAGINILMSGVFGAADGFNKLSLNATSFTNVYESISKVPVIGNLLSGLGLLKAAFKDLAESADVGLKFRQQFLEMSASTGNLNEIYKKSGEGLQNLNILLNQHAIQLKNSAIATGSTLEQTNKWYAELGQIPGSLNSIVSVSKLASENQDMLTAAMRMASATGMDQASVTGLLTTAYEKYGLVGEKALNMIARISDESNKLGVRLKDVKGFITEVANQFQFFGDQTTAAANVLDKMVSAFDKTKISGTNAIAIVQSMVGNLKSLSIGAKAFISGQTGGPGGLMGAFQIDKLLSEGKMDVVFDKVKQQMTKMMGGNIVTLQEAAASPQAAAQMQKQVQMLTEGPLGKMIQSPDQAYQLLDAMKRQERMGAGGVSKEEASRLFGGGKPEEGKRTDQQLTNDLLVQGNEVQKGIRSILTEKLAGFEGAKLMAGISSMGTFLNLFGEGKTSEKLDGIDQNALNKVKRRISETAKKAQQGNVFGVDRSNMLGASYDPAKTALKDAAEMAANIPGEAKEIGKVVGQFVGGVINSPKPQSQAQVYQKHEREGESRDKQQGIKINHTPLLSNGKPLLNRRMALTKPKPPSEIISELIEKPAFINEENPIKQVVHTKKASVNTTEVLKRTNQLSKNDATTLQEAAYNPRVSEQLKKAKDSQLSKNDATTLQEAAYNPRVSEQLKKAKDSQLDEIIKSDKFNRKTGINSPELKLPELQSVKYTEQKPFVPPPESGIIIPPVNKFTVQKKIPLNLELNKLDNKIKKENLQINRETTEEKLTPMQKSTQYLQGVVGQIASRDVKDKKATFSQDYKNFNELYNRGVTPEVVQPTTSIGRGSVKEDAKNEEQIVKPQVVDIKVSGGLCTECNKKIIEVAINGINKDLNEFKGDLSNRNS